MMRNKMLVTTVAVAVAVALLLGGLLTVLLVDFVTNKHNEENRLAFEAESKELVMSKQELLLEYSNLEENKLYGLKGDSFLDIVFTELDKQLYDSIFPIFNDRKVPMSGTMCLSVGELPGYDGMISRQEFDIMLLNGWRYVMYWDGHGDLDVYISKLKEELSENNIEIPDTMFFAQDSYSADYDELLYSEGILHAVHHGDNGLPIVEKGTVGDVWHPGSVGWNTTGVSKNLLNEVIINGGCAVFEVNFSGTYDAFYHYEDLGRVEAFKRMMDVIGESYAKGEIEMTSFSKAKKGRADYFVAKADVLVYVKQRREEILLEIEEIEKQILEIYNKYN